MKRRQIDGRTTRWGPRMTADEFWALSSPVPFLGCWIYTKTTPGDLYGSGRVEGVRENKSSRVAWVLSRGRRIPAGMVVMHRCDVKGCVNPDHLELGTASQNAKDAWARIPGLVRRRRAA